MLHPVLYKHYLPEAEKKFAKLAVNVWGIDPADKSEAELASAFIQALQDFIKEIGLPASLHEMNINLSEEETAEIAASTILTGGCVKKFTIEELQEVLNECA